MKGTITEFDDYGNIKKRTNVDFRFCTGDKGELAIDIPDRTKTRHRELLIPLKKLIRQMNKQFKGSELEVQDFYDQVADAL